ncbi:hypothetical protein [Haladaptatus sp. CMAA 1911]|uniref:hypothetical protein n=1 Tax=unclassified Haladaptatus TaxID=2622732 RepID=UPI003754F50D
MLESSMFIVPTFFLLLGVLETMGRYARIQSGTQLPHIDVRCCWRPLAEAVLAGKPIYVRPAIDNKPPLFELLNITVAATGHYLLVFFVLVGLANAVIAILLWRICKQHDASHIGLVAGLLFLTSVPVAGGTVINVRSFATAGILLSLSVSNPAARGANIAVAGLFSQYAVFAIPALAYDRLRELDRESGIKWLASFTFAGLGVVAITFAFVYVVWGETSFNGAIYWSFGAAEKYTTNPVVPSLIGDTSQWMSALYREALNHFVLIVPAVIVVQLVLFTRDAKRPTLSTNVPVMTTAFLVVSMILPLFVRAYRAYWLYPLPFLALLAATCYQEFFMASTE